MTAGWLINDKTTLVATPKTSRLKKDLNKSTLNKIGKQNKI